MKNNDWKERLNIVYSTNSDFKYETTEDEKEQETLAPEKQHLRIELDKRKGNLATIISGFIGTDEDLKDLAKNLKVGCGAGGSSRDNEILIQGDMRKKIGEFLNKKGYKTKII